MKILQGRYIAGIEATNRKGVSKGTLKAIRLETDRGEQTIRLSKSLGAIAQQELILNEPIRIWAVADAQKTKSQLSSKPAKNKKLNKKLKAVAIVPLSPKSHLDESAHDLADELVANAEDRNPKKIAPRPHQLTVQICQKKNCCKRGGDKLWQAFEQKAGEQPSEISSVSISTTSAPQAIAPSFKPQPFKLKATGCLGGCKRGPNIRMMPANVKYYHVQPADINDLLARHIS